MELKKDIKVKVSVPIVFLFLLLMVSRATSLQVYWTGASDNLWNTAGNWSTGTVPTINDTAYFNATASNCMLNGPVYLTSLIFSPAYTGVFTQSNFKIIVSGDLDFSTGGAFAFTVGDTILCTSSSVQKIVGKQGENLPIIIKEGPGTLEAYAVGFKVWGLILREGTVSNSSALDDTISGDFICSGGELKLNSGSLVLNGDADFTGILNFTDNSGKMYFNGSSSQTIKPNPSVKIPAVYKISPGNLTIMNSHFHSRNLTIQSGQVIINNSYNIDSINIFSGATLQSSMAIAWRDTISHIDGNGNFYLSNDELFFVGNVLNCSLLSTFNAGPSSAVVFIGSNQTFIPKSFSIIPKLRQNGSGTTTVSTYGFIVDTLEIISGEFHLGSGLIDSVSRAVKLLGGTLNFGSSTLGVGADTLNLNSAGTIIPGTGYLNYSKYINRVFIPRSDGVYPRITISGMTTYIRGNHFKAPNVNIYNGTIEIDTTFSIDTINIGTGSILRCNSIDGNRDTVKLLMGNGSVELGKSELCFNDPQVDLSSNTSIMGGTISFIGTNQTFTPSMSFTYNKIRQKSSGITTVVTNGLKVDTLEIISGEFNLGSGLIDSVSRAVKLLGGTLNFSSSTLGVGADTLNLNGAGTIIPGTGYLNYSKYTNRVFIPRSDGVYPRINISGMTTYIRGNHFKAPNVNIYNGTIEIDTTFSIDTINIGTGSILRCSNSSGTSDTVKVLIGVGSIELNNSELCFNAPQVDLSVNASIMGGVISFIGSNQTFKPAMYFTYNKIRQKGSGITTVITNGLRVDTLEIASGEFNLGNGLVDSVGRALKMLGGTLNFGSSVLRNSSVNLDLTGSGTIIPSDGKLEFLGMITQYFTPPLTGIVPKIISKSDQLHIGGTTLRASYLNVNSGMVIMDTTMNVDTLKIDNGGHLSFDNDTNILDTIGCIQGNGSLSFGKTTLHITKNASFSDFNAINGIANLELEPTEDAFFKPKQMFTFNTINKIGPFMTTVDMYCLSVKKLFINNGVWNWGTTSNDTIYDTLFLKNSTMIAGNASVNFKNFINMNGHFELGYGHFVKIGGDAVIDFSDASEITWHYGSIRIEGEPGSVTTIIPSPTYRFPNIEKSGSDTVKLLGNFLGSKINHNNGGWDWGNNFYHSLHSLSMNMGTMDFKNSTVNIDSGEVSFFNGDDIKWCTGRIELSASNRIQTFVPHPTKVLPDIVKSNSSTIKFSGNTLKCHSYLQTGGNIEFTGLGIQSESDIEFNGADTLKMLDGITLQAVDEIKLKGAPEKFLKCIGESVWNIVIPGSLTANFAELKNCVVSGTTGIAYGPSMDLGGNVNWNFWIDTFPPDNDISIQLVDLDTGSVRISWNPIVVDSLDAAEIGIWYSSARMPESIHDDSASLLGYYSLNDSVDTVINLHAHTNYYFALAVSDTSGNWSDFTTNSSRSVRTRAVAPQILSAPDTIHSISFPLSWKCPPGLTTNDLLYIHIAEVGNPSSKVFAAFSSATTSATIQLPVKEALYKFMLSSSQDSAGLYYIDDTYRDSVRFTIDPPTLTTSKDTFNNFYPIIYWIAPYGFSAADSFFVYTDTINGSGGWVLKGKYPGSETSHQCVFTGYGAYKIMVATNWDRNGNISPDNVVIDTIYLVPSTSVYSWDASSDTGYQVAAGVWGSNRYWSTDGRSLISWPGAGNSARFTGSLGNTIIIGVSGTQNADSIIFDTKGITLSGGTLNLISGVIRGNATDTIYSSIISKNIYKTGYGEIVTNGINQCDTLQINSGILTINRTDTGSAMLPRVLVVNKSTRLNGNGRIAGKVLVNSGSVLSPGGAATQSVTMDELSMISGCMLNVDIGSQFDTIIVKNRVSLAGSINIQAVNGFGKGMYPIIRCIGTIIDSGVQISKTPSSLYRYSLRTENSTVVLYIDSIVTDTTPPKVSVRLTSGTVLASVPASISGTAYDSTSGLLSISILVSKYKDTTYWNGTTWQKSIFWIPLQKQSQWVYSTAGMICSDGKYVIKTGATDSIGNIGYDTTFFIVDATPPVVTKIFDNLDSIGSWTGLISGEAEDSFSVIKKISVSVKNDSGKFYDGTNWSAQERFLICDGTSAWSIQIGKQSLVDGNYTISVISDDTVGNVSSKPLYKNYKYFLKNEINRANLRSTAVNCSTAVYSWKKQDPATIDSFQLIISKLKIPLSLQDGEYQYVGSNNNTTMVVGGLPGDGLKIFARIFFKQRSGGYLSNYDSIGNLLQLPDCIAPQNLVRISLSNIGDTLIRAALKTENTEQVKILAGIGVSKESAKLSVKEINSNDTLINIRSTVPGIFYFATASRDLSGNISSVNYDSISIKNSVPKIRSLSDTTVVEGKTFTRQVFATDVNNDSLTFKLIQLKSGMDLSRAIFRWTPKNSDAGFNTVIIECMDAQGASVYDTFIVSVKDVPEPPVVSYEGSFEVYEDSNYSGSIKIVDPDFSDTSKVSIVKMPAWLKLTQNTLNGKPQNDDVGIHSVELIYQDKDSLLDTLAFQVKVINTNDAPVLISGTLQDTMTEKQKYTCELKIADQDNNDSIIAKNVSGKTWVKISSVKRSTNSGEWQMSTIYSPLQADTGLHEIKLEIADKSGATIYYSKKIRILDADDPPAKPLLVRKTASGAVQYTVNASDDRDKLLTYSVKLRYLKNDSLIYSDSSVKIMYAMYPLCDGRYEFKASAIDNSGLKSGVTADTFTIQGASEYIIKDTGWGMVSIPSKKYNVSDLKNSDYVLHWDESGVEKQVYSFYKTKTELIEIEPSKAYWRKGSLPDTIHLTSSEFVKEPVSVKLYKNSSGWNQISSPFPYPVTWSRKNDILWKWNLNTNDYEEVQNILEPWSGYWVRVDTTTEAVLSPVPVFGSGSLLKLRKTYFQSKTNWVMQVSLKSSAGNDADNKFGFNQNALDQLDEFDRPEPPALEGRPVLFFSHNEWNNSCKDFASDIRKTWKSVNIFEIALEGGVKTDTATLNFNGFDNGSDLYLFTKLGDSIFQIDQSQKYTVTLQKGTNTYQTVFVTDNAGFLKAFPLHFMMSNPYPNPFCPLTKINYTLPYRWSSDGKINQNPYLVSIAIYDIMGRNLRNLIYRKMVPGNYTVIWDGKMTNGRIAASGKYYCVLKADDLKHVRNMTLIK